MNTFLRKLSISLFAIIICVGCRTVSFESQDEDTVEETFAEISEERKLQAETEHFKYYSRDLDVNFVDILVEEMESQYKRISEAYDHSRKKKMDIQIYDSRVFQKLTGLPAWSDGGYYSEGINIKNNYNVEIAVHEITHVIIQDINPNTPRWLNEGISSFEGQDIHSHTYIPSIVQNGFDTDTIPTFSSYTIRDPSEFVAIGGYPFAYTMIEYIVEQYGRVKLNQLVRSPYDWEDIFGMSGEQFWKDWVEYLRKTNMLD